MLQAWIVTAPVTKRSEPVVPPLRCWADSGFRKVTNGDTGVETTVPLDCNALATEDQIGLCPRHYTEIVGSRP